MLSSAACKRSHKNDAFHEQVFATADKLFNENKGRAAINYIDSVFGHERSVDPYYQYQRYHLKQIFYYYSHIYDSCDMYVDSTLAVLENNHLSEDHPAEYADALNSKGDYYYARNDLNQAFEYYYRSRRAAIKANDYCAFANQSYHLGMVSYRQEKYNDAIGYFQQTMVENKSCGKDSITFYKEEEMLNNIALAFTQLKKYDSAEAYYNKAVQFLDQETRKYGSTVKQYSQIATGVIYGNLAKVFIAEGKSDSARLLLQKSIAINSRSGYDNNDAMFARIQLAELYYALRDYGATIQTLTELQEKLDSLPNINIELRRRHLLSEYYSATGATVPALNYLQDYLQLKDSTDARDKQLKRTDVTQLLKNQEAQYQVTLLKKDNQLNRLYLAITVGFSLLTVIIIGLVLVNYRRSRKNVRKLTELNNQINEQKAQLEFTTNELKKINREKDRILHVVAHDLRNPIGGILALSDIVLSDEASDDQKDSWEMVKNTAQLSLKLINRLSELETDLSLESMGAKTITDVNEVAKQVTALLQFKAVEKKQELNLTLFPQPLNILANKERIWRVLSNIIGNAIKFSAVDSAIYITVSADNKNAIMEIKDSGVGIPEHLRPYIFDMFTKAKRKGTDGENSFGLGLSICKQIVEDHNGKIWFETIEEKGTSFFIAVPLAVNQ